MGVPIIAEFNLQEREQWNVTHETATNCFMIQKKTARVLAIHTAEKWGKM